MMTTNNMSERIAVIGGGSWGTALANRLAANGHDVCLWAYEAELVREINEAHTNSLFLPGIALHTALTCSGSLQEAAAGRTIVLLVTPVQVMRGVLKQLAPHIGPSAIIANASKGIELETLRTVSQICAELLPPELTQRFVALSGPTFAREVAQGLPSLIVAASRDEAAARSQCDGEIVGSRRRSALHHIAEHRQHLVRGSWLERPRVDHVCLQRGRAVRVQHALDGARLHAVPVVDKDREGGGQLERRHLTGSQRERGHVRKLLHPERRGELQHGTRAYLLLHRGGGPVVALD